MEKFLEHLQEAERIIHAVDHMTYITFPLIKDKRLLLKILTETKIAITNCISAILQYEYINNRVVLYKSAKENFKTFMNRCAERYDISKEDVESVLELFDIIEKYKDSPINFMKDEKIVILSENMKEKIISLEKIKSFLYLSKSILKKTKQEFMR